ncbi:MAG TPA: N-acetylmuramic acid 6-phosphate etherase [Chondromyces sp.]|nr:N-acetylmuramic acid 6-phosphate etherase [Chondromyces sp.]
MTDAPLRPTLEDGAPATDNGWGTLPTEASNPSSEGLDTLTIPEVVSLLLEEDRRGLETALRSREFIAQAAEWVAETLEGGGEVLFAGAGTSGRLGILEAAECPPTFGTEPERIRAVIAGGRDAVFAAREGAEDIAEDGAAAARHLGSGDLLIAISASSVTPYVLGALATARGNGARTILLTCAPPGMNPAVADLVLALDTGPEVLTGSTRLKAGSATKAVLNAITTAAMVRVGKVYGNLMVDLRAGSAKLRDRALRIIQAAGEVSREDAARLYDAAGGEVKTAIVMARRGLDLEVARAQLKAAGGNVRAALADRSNAPKGV